MTTKLGKIFDAYAARKGLEPNALRFTFDGQRVDRNSTPKMMEMEDNDQIDVFLQQVGGADDAAPAPAPEAPMTIRVKGQGGDEIQFKVRAYVAMAM